MSHLDEAPREAGPTVPGRRVALYCLAIISVGLAVRV